MGSNNFRKILGHVHEGISRNPPYCTTPFVHKPVVLNMPKMADFGRILCIKSLEMVKTNRNRVQNDRQSTPENFLEMFGGKKSTFDPNITFLLFFWPLHCTKWAILYSVVAKKTVKWR